MWNAAYPDHLIYNKKESFYRKTIKPNDKNEMKNSPIKKKLQNSFQKEPTNQPLSVSFGVLEKTKTEPENPQTLNELFSSTSFNSISYKEIP